MVLDHHKRMLHFGAHTGLELFYLVEHGVGFFVLALSHGDIPADTFLGFGSYLNTLVSCLAKKGVYGPCGKVLTSAM